MKFFRTALVALTAFTALPSFAGSWHDDFEGGGLDDWTVYNEDPGAELWEEENGIVFGEIFLPGFFSILQLTPPGVDTERWENYTVKVRMRLETDEDDGNDTAFGVVLYDFDLDLNQYHLVLLQLHEQNIYAGIRTENGAGADSFPFETRQGVWYDLQASVETMGDSERITIQVDDNAPISFTWAAAVGSGGVGLAVSDARVSFDDFVVEGASISNGGNGLPRAVSPIGMAAQLWGDLKQ